MPKMPKINFSNKWTTLAGIVILAGTALTCIGNLMTFDMTAMDCLKESWVAIAAGVVALKAADGGL